MPEPPEMGLEVLDFRSPWHYVLEGEYLRAQSLVLSRPPLQGGAPQEGPGHRLYRQLAGSVQQTSTGEVVLREDWRQAAVDFANAYAPPVEDWAEVLDRGARIPVARAGHEALLAWWLLHLQELLCASSEPEPEALLAATCELCYLEVSCEESDRVLLGLPPPPTAERARLTAGLSRPQVQAVIAHLDSSQRHPEAARRLALAAFATGLDVRLRGAHPSCLFARAPGAEPAAGFVFAGPRARIWFGFWEDLGRRPLRACEHCGRMFRPARRDSRACSRRCVNALAQRAWRARQQAPPRAQ